MATQTDYIGSELKYLVEITAGGFNMMDDNFEIEVSVGNKKKIYAKSDLLIDQEGNFYLVIDSSEFKSGDMYATTFVYIPDNDFPDGLRTEIEKTKLTRIEKL